MRKNIFIITILLILSICNYILSSCGTQPQTNEKTDYEETKKMVVDILKTDEGKKAIQDVLKNEEMQQTLIMDQRIVTETIQNSLVSEQGSKTIQKMFEDPKFVEKYAKNMKKEHEEIIKDLMKDPEYQKMVIEIFQDPEIQKVIQTSIKSHEIRKHLQDVILETLESPLFKVKMEEALLKVAKESIQKTGDNSEKQKEQNTSDSGSHHE